MQIPKVIHYCWFGGKPLPKSAEKCIRSWQKYLPEYEIKRWDESNFDVHKVPYISQAYKARKFAFVSDYARFWILYRYGGLYFDTDVEVINSIDDIIAAGPFMGCETSILNGDDTRPITVAPGLGLAAEPSMPLYKDILDFYGSINFQSTSGGNPETVVTYITRILKERGLKNVAGIQQIAGVNIYPSDYFCPISVVDGKMRITENTRSIHHYDQTWQSPWRKYGRKLVLSFGGVKLKRALKKVFFK